MEARQLAGAAALGRIALGLAALAAPVGISRAMFGGAGAQSGMSLYARMLGGRDLALGLGALVALERGSPARHWFEAAALADGVDFAGAVLARADVHPRTYPGLLAVTAGASLTHVWLSRRLDGPPDYDPSPTG